MKLTKTTLSIATALLFSSNLMADDIADLKTEIAELKEQTQALIDEGANTQTGFNYTIADNEKSYSGLGGAASKVYYSKSPLSIGGYGEMYYSNTNNEDGTNQSETQVKRFITYLGYKFSDNIILNTELEYEGGGVTTGGSGDEVKVEFIYIDFLMHKNLNLRAGNFLIPMGLTNQQHEPTLFTTVQRPKTSYYIIPSTWNESGAMAYGNIIDGVEYKVAAINALQLDDAAGDKWLRSGRGGSFKVVDPKLATLARVDYTGTNGLLLGASVYNSSDVLIWDTHVDYKQNGARLYGTYAQTSRSNETPNSTNVTESFGGYLNASFDVLSLTSSDNKLPLFVQYESYNPQSKRADGTSRDATTDISLGANYFPHPQVVVKADYVMSTTNSITDNIASVSLGFIF